jgi:hypothetical protein
MVKMFFVIGDELRSAKDARRDPHGCRGGVLKSGASRKYFSWRLSRYRHRNKKKGDKSCRLG